MGTKYFPVGRERSGNKSGKSRGKVGEQVGKQVGKHVCMSGGTEIVSWLSSQMLLFMYLVCVTQESKVPPTAVHVREHPARTI